MCVPSLQAQFRSAYRGGWRDGEVVPAGTDAAHPAVDQPQRQQDAQDAVPASPHLRFRSAPAGFSQLQGGQNGWAAWDGLGSRSQMQELREMMGEGPLFDGIHPAEIQEGRHENQDLVLCFRGLEIDFVLVRSL